MEKHRRYQLTERQLAPVIRYINENYPDGVTDRNFDRLSGANTDQYETIFSVRYDHKTDDLYFEVETQNGQMLTKRLQNTNALYQTIDKELTTLGLPEGSEWEILTAGIKNHHLILNLAVNQQQHQVNIPTDYVITWLEEMNDEDFHPSEPDPDERYDREREEKY